jgi:hypothetical protein
MASNPGLMTVAGACRFVRAENRAAEFLSTKTFCIFSRAQKLHRLLAASTQQLSDWQGFVNRRRNPSRRVFPRGCSTIVFSDEFLSSGIPV